LERLRALIATYGLDTLRFYLLRAAPFGADLDFNDADFVRSFNELANVLGNCLNRTINMIGKYRDRTLAPPSGGINAGLEKDLLERIHALPAALAGAYQKLELQQCVILPLDLARATNGFIDATRPFSLAKDPAQQDRLNTVLYLSAQAIYRALAAMLPVMPEKAAAGLAQLGVDVQGKRFAELFGTLPVGQKLAEAQPLFPKVL
jgi:methionyl-tRNA synthetase